MMTTQSIAVLLMVTTSLLGRSAVVSAFASLSSPPSPSSRWCEEGPRRGRKSRRGVRALSESSSSSSSSFSASEDVQLLPTAVLSPTHLEEKKAYDPADVFHQEDIISNDQGGVLAFPPDMMTKMDIDDTLLDIVQDLDGNPLSTEYFSKAMGVKHAEGFVCLEKDAFRGFMSNGCRIRLYPGGESAFYKRIVFDDLEHAKEKLAKSPFKLVRDAKSYHVVASFLTSRSCQQLMDATQNNVCIPKCYDAELRPDDTDPMKSKFSFLLEDFSPSAGWYQRWLLEDREECKAALSAYAQMHGFFWTGSNFWRKANAEAADELEKGVWESGSYVQPKAQDEGQCSQVTSEWAKKRLKFEKQLSSFDFWDNLGERLESVSKECGRKAHPFADDELSNSFEKYRTFTHGDPKAANLFFRDCRTVESQPKVQVGLIDFQWSGFGLAASDVAHFMTSAVHADELVNGGEEELLKFYYDELTQSLLRFGVFGSKKEMEQEFSFDLFMEQYNEAFLDICRLVIAYTWSRFEEPVESHDHAACARTMNKTSYNKSIPNVVWLMSRCDEILKANGV